MPTSRERSERVIHSLLPETHLEHQYDEPTTLASRIAYHATPGVSIAVIHNYEIEWARGFGLCEVGQPDPVTTETLFQSGSISKPVFALAVMRLVEQGVLDLDEDVNTYLTTWRVPANGTWQPRVTLRQLLSHTAGMTVHGFPGYPNGHAIPTVRQVLDGEPPANTSAVRVNLLPGMQFRYSGGGTTIAQQVVVDVLRKPFPAIMRELVLDPVGADHSTYEQPLPSEWARRAATAHPLNAQPLRGNYHIYPEMAAAGLWSTASDLARIGLAVQRALRGDANSLISQATAHQMLTAQTSAGDEQIGIGFFLMGREPALRFGHGGWDEGFIARLTLYQEGGMGCAIMVNSNQGHPLPGEIERAIAKEYGWPGYFVEKKTVEISSEQLAEYVGQYPTDNGLIFAITATEHTLWVQPPGQAPLPLHAESTTKFFTPALNSEVTFEKTEAGGVTSFTLNQGGRQFNIKKQQAS